MTDSPSEAAYPARWSLKVADHVICVSDTTRDSLLRAFDIAPAQVTTIHHGIDHVHAVPAADRSFEPNFAETAGRQPDLRPHARGP